MSSSVQIYSGDDGILSIDTDICIAQNEPFVEHIFNRNAGKLLKNDLALHQMYKKVFEKLNIKDYSSSAKYSIGDLIWYGEDGDLYLLKCISPISGKPNIKKNADGRVNDDTLKKSGWDNQNRHLTIVDYGIASLLSALVDDAIEQHQESSATHPNGIVNNDPTSVDYIGNKLLYRDMSNIDPTRQTVFFPVDVSRVKSDNVIMTGYMRDFGKVIEYDFVFKLASSSIKQDDTQVFVGSSALSANTLKLQVYTGLTQNATGYQDNEKYFHSSLMMDIFAPEFPAKQTCEAKIGLLKQASRNGYANSYSATITFPRPFSDRNYMVFANSVLSQTNSRVESSKHLLTPSQSDIVVCNKTRESITLLDITFPDAGSFTSPEQAASSGGLAANSFHCKVIGRSGE